MRPYYRLAILFLICASQSVAQAEIKQGEAVPVLEDPPELLHDIADPIATDATLEEETPCAFILFEKSTLPQEQAIAVCKAALKTLKAEQSIPIDFDHGPHPEEPSEEAMKRSGGGTTCSVVGEAGASCQR